MHLRNILAIARKDALDILLNKSTLAGLLTPILLALVFLLITVLVGNHTTQILVYNPSNSGVVNVVSSAFSDSQVVQVSSAADVAAQFGPNGTHKSSSYAIGMVIPTDFDSNIKAGARPQLSLYINGDEVGTQQSLLVQTAIANYARVVASPQPPLILMAATINPPSNTNIDFDIGQVYAVSALMVSFITGLVLMPSLLIEEKEKKTLRMLMVTPASFGDVIIGKMLTVLVYQLILSSIVLAIVSGYTGDILLVLLYMLLGACFGLALGLLFGSVFQTTTAAGGVSGVIGFIYILPVFFVGQLGNLLGSSPFVQVIKALPTYYMADGISNAMTGQGTFADALLDISVTLASIVVLLAIASWALRRQASVVAAI